MIEKRLNSGEYESNNKSKSEQKESQEPEAGAVVSDGNGIVERSQMSLANIFFKVRYLPYYSNLRCTAVTRRHVSDATSADQQRARASP